MATWHELTRDPEYQALSQKAKALVKQGFFQQQIANDPEYQSFSPETQKAIADDFWNTPDDTGQGYVSSMLGSAGRGFGEIVPGTVTGVGALLGSEGIQGAGESLREGLEYIAPVNPIYQDDLAMKGMNVLGTVGSIMATGGIGGAAGRGLAAEGIAAAGTQAAKQALARQAIQRGASSALYGTGFAQGAAQKAEENKRLGMEGPEAYLNLIGGGLSEVLPEMLPFGTALETASARRMLGGVDEAGKVIPGIRMSAAQEALEGGTTQSLSNLSTQLTAPEGVETPGLFEGFGEAALWEGVGGSMFGAINKLGRTPLDKQTEAQNRIATEAGAIPTNAVPEQTNEQKLAAMQAGGTTVVDPDGKTAVLVEPPKVAPTDPGIQAAKDLVTPTAAVPGAEQTAVLADEQIQQNEDLAKNIAASMPAPPTEPTVQPVKTAEAVESEVTGIEPTSSISDYDVDEVADTWLSTQPKGMAESIAKNAQQAVNENRPFFGGFVDENGDLVLGRFAAYRQALRRIGKDVDINNPIGDLQRWKKSGVKNYPIIDYVPAPLSQISSVTPSLETEMPEKPSQTITGSNGEIAPEMPVQPQAGEAMAFPPAPSLQEGGSILERAIINNPPSVSPLIQPATPQENAPDQIPDTESLRQEPEDRVESRETKKTGVSDQLLSPAAGEEKVAGSKTPKGQIVHVPGWGDRIQGVEKGSKLKLIDGSIADGTVLGRSVNGMFDMSDGSVIDTSFVSAFKPAGEKSFVNVLKKQPATSGLVEVSDSERGGTWYVPRNQWESESSLLDQVDPNNPTISKAIRPRDKLREVVASKPQQPITPQGTPTPATEGMPTSRDVGTSFQPGATGEPVQAAPPAAQAVKATAPGPVSGKKPTTLDLARQELEQARGVKPNWAPKAERFAQIYEGEDIRPEIAAKNGEALMSAIQNKQWTDLLHPDNKVSRKVWKEWTGKALPAGLKASQKAFKDFLDAAYPSSQQTTAAVKQTPAPSRKGAGAAGVTERQPSGGSIPEVASSETQETQPSTKENDAVAKIDRLVSSGAKPEEMDKFVKSLSDDEFNALVESEAFDVDTKLAIKPKDTYDAKRIKRRKFVDQINATAVQSKKTAEEIFKEEEAALERQRKLDERIRQSLNSIIDPEKTNIVQGTVSAADAEAARRVLNNSGEIPNAFLTRIYASPEAFLAEKSNQRYFPSSYARLQAESNIEGLFERGQTLIFANKIGVSDLDRRIGENLGISPEQAAARRVIAHENGHRSVALFTASEKREFLGYLRRKYNDAQIDNLVRVYSEYADWRTNLESRNEALEELFLKDFERLEKIPTGGIWDDIVQFLKRVWRRLTGRKGDPTLQDMKDVVRLLRNAMRRTAVPSFTTKDGGDVKLSYAGEKAIENLPEERRQFMRDSLDTAKAMAAAGKDSEEIRAVTGWFPGPYDGKMRWEVPDNKATESLEGTFAARSNAKESSEEQRRRLYFSHPKNVREYEIEPFKASFFGKKTYRAYKKYAPMDSLLRSNRVDFLESEPLGVFATEAEAQAAIDLDKAQFESRRMEAIRNTSSFDIRFKDVLQHPELFAAYPKFQNVKVSMAPAFFDIFQGVQGWYNDKTNTINVTPYASNKLSTLLHEIQHLIQNEENFARGSNLDEAFSGVSQQAILEKAKEIADSIRAQQEVLKGYMRNRLADLDRATTAEEKEIADRGIQTIGKWFNSEQKTLEALESGDLEKISNVVQNRYSGEFYERVAGEIEARDVQARQKLTPEQRKAIAPYSSENIAKEDAIVMFGGGGAQMSMASMSSQDAEYLAALESGDMEKAQRMVDEAAKAAGYDTEVWHGTDEDFTVFGEQRTAYGFFFAPDKRTAEYYGPARKYSLRINKLADLTDPAVFDEVAGEAIWSDTKERKKEDVDAWIESVVKDTPNGRAFAANALGLSESEMAEFESFEDIISELQKEWEGVVETVEADYPKALESLDKAAPQFNQEVEDARQAHDNLEQSWYMEYQDDFIRAAQTLGYDGVFMYDPAGSTGGSPESYVVFSPEQIKSADPVTYGEAGNVIPLSQRFQAASPDIRFSRVEYASDYSAASSAGAQLARDTIYDDRIIEMRDAIRRAYEAMPKPNSVAVPIGELFAKTEELMPGVTQDEFSNVLQDLFEDNGAVLQEGESAFDVFTPEGRRAGFAVIMPKRAVASRVETEGEAVKNFQEEIEAIEGNSLNAFSKARPMEGADAEIYTVKPSKFYKQVANDFVNKLIDEGNSIESIGESLFSEDFLQEVGIKNNMPALVMLVAVVKDRVSKQSRDTSDGDTGNLRRVILQKLDRRLAGYWQNLGTNSGRAQGIRSYITKSPEFSWMFIFDRANENLEKEGKLAAARVASDLPQTADNLQKTDAKAGEDAGEQVADDLEDNQDAIDLAEGEATLDQKGKTLWEKFKDLIRKRGIAMRALNALRAGNKAKASISSEERNTISQMSEEELVKFIAGIDKEMAGVFDEFTKTPATRKKREKMVATAKKRVEQGKPIDVTSVNTADVIDGIFVGFNDRESIINEVGDTLLKAAEQRKVKPKQKTAIQDLIAAIRQTLTANLKGEQIKADQPSLGKLLGKTFAQQGSEAALFAKSWEDGRKKVRAMLAEMGVDEASLDEELDAIMPPTPTLAYAPAAAKKAINVAIKEAGLTPQDALSNPAFFRESIMAKFNEAAEKDNLTEEGWNQSGKALAEKAINEFIDNARIKAEKRSAESKAKMEKRKVEIADKRASQLIYSVEERFRQGEKDLQTSKSGDSINKAFRDQVKDPVSKFEFFQRLAKLNVSQNVSEHLFRTAAREKADLKAMEAFRRLEGPNALQTMQREISALRPGEQAPFSKQIPWRKLLSQKAATVKIYRQRIFDTISSEESFADLDDAQKAKLADLLTKAWESKREAILDRMVKNVINQEQAAGRLTKEGADALRSQRQKLVEDINLGILDEDRLMKHLADKFGIKSEFTEAERANIDRLLDILQDDKLNEVKRNKAGYELLEALSSAAKIPIAKLLADYWVSSVLSGVNTAASIAMAVMSGGYELTTGAFRILRAGFTNPKELPAEIAASFKAMAEFLKAFGREGRLAWQYLVTGDRAFLDPSMNTVLNDLNYDSIGKTVSLAEKMAKSDKIMQRVMGIWMRSVSRLLTALDSFNSGVTKAGALPIVFRQLNLDAESLKQATEKYNLQLYRDRVIQRDFNGNKPTTAHDKALVDSYAKAEMMADLQEFGKFSENADFFGQQGAMTLDPTGVGGFIYSSIKSFTGGATNRADKFLAEAELEWKQADGADKTAKGLQLAFAYFLQFGAYNIANLAGLRFARFAGNKFNQGLSFIPGIGMLRMYEATVKDSKIEAKEAFTDMILRNQTAGLLFAIIGGMAIKAIMDEPDDEKRGFFWNGGWANLTPDRKQQKLAAGQKEYTIGIPGGISFNYQNWPISPIMAAIGSLSDLVRFSPEQWNEKSIADRLVSAAASGVFSAGEIPALSGFQTLFGNNLSSKDPNEKRLDRFAKVMAGWGGGFVPRILKDIDFMADPGLRKYESLWEQTASHIPVYRRYSGEEYYDILGKQIERKVWPGSREFMELESAPEYRTLGKLNSRGIWLTPANAEHRMVGKGRFKRKLTQEEADAYSLETGKGYRQMLLRYGSRLEQMPTERARAFLMDKADEVRDRALQKITR